MSGGGSEEQVIGNKYSFDLHVELGHGPFDKVTRIWFEDRLAWEGSASSGEITIDKPELYGGKSNEGGVKGKIEILTGADDQMPNAYLESAVGFPLGGLRGIFGLLFKQFYFGNSWYPKPCEVEAVRVHSKDGSGALQWYDAKAELSNDRMNGVHILRELFTNKAWGMGATEFDMGDSWIAAADTAYAEGFGLGFLWDNPTEIEQMIDVVKSHIDAETYVNRKTGKYEIKLIRKDYDVETLPTLEGDNIVFVDNINRPEPTEQYNSVIVKYYDHETGKLVTTPAQRDIALVGKAGRRIEKVQEYIGIDDPDLANQVCSRDLLVLSSTPRSCTVGINRVPLDDEQFYRGFPIILNRPEDGFDETVMRIMDIRLGTPENAMVEVDLIEDRFQLPQPIYATPEASKWKPLSNDPEPAEHRLIQSAPYREIVQAVGDVEAQALTGEYIFACGSKPTSDAAGGEFWTDAGGGAFIQSGNISYAPTALLETAISYEDEVITLKEGTGLQNVAVGQVFQINQEIMYIESISLPNVTVKRGLLDTIPHEHGVNSRAYFWDVYGHSDRIEYTTSDTVGVKMRTITGKGVLSEASTPTDFYAVLKRQSRPYPAANVKINAQYYPASVSGPDIVITLSHRDRLLQSDGLLHWKEGDEGPEPGVQYRYIIDDQSGNVDDVTKDSDVDAAASKTHTYTLSGSETELRIRIRVIRDGLEAWQEFDYTVSIV